LFSPSSGQEGFAAYGSAGYNAERSAETWVFSTEGIDMSDYLVCFTCHQRFIMAAMDRWLDHHFRCGSEGVTGPGGSQKHGSGSDLLNPNRLPDLSSAPELLID
jgi:hypothetical protein